MARPARSYQKHHCSSALQIFVPFDSIEDTKGKKKNIENLGQVEYMYNFRVLEGGEDGLLGN